MEFGVRLHGDDLLFITERARYALQTVVLFAVFVALRLSRCAFLLAPLESNAVHTDLSCLEPKRKSREFSGHTQATLNLSFKL